MKLKVTATFRDKNDHVTVYEPGKILDIEDKERAADLIKRGLCAEYKTENSDKVSKGKKTNKANAAGKSKKEQPDNTETATADDPAEDSVEETESGNSETEDTK